MNQGTNAPTYPLSTWRLLSQPATDGATNMALDEAIMNAVIEGSSPPTLRFFAWSPPCLSLGRSQSLSDVDLPACRTAGVDVVRRPTGGRAILHTDELTYTVCLLKDDPRASGDIIDSYRRLSEGLLAGLRRLGVEAVQARRSETGGARADETAVCFETPSDYEITVQGRKLLGSAQWRARGGVLQHGTLPLHGDIARIVDCLSFPPEQRDTQKRVVHARALTLEEALGERVTWARAAVAMADGFAEALNLTLVPGAVTERELEMAGGYRRDRYASQEWTAKG